MVLSARSVDVGRAGRFDRLPARYGDKEKPMSPDHPQNEGMSDIRADLEVREPRKFKVLLHNDDYTTMEFVVEILRTVFRKSPEQASAIMSSVHERGLGVCGVYTEEVAETKVMQVHEKARSAGFPLRCSMEEE